METEIKRNKVTVTVRGNFTCIPPPWSIAGTRSWLLSCHLSWAESTHPPTRALIGVSPSNPTKGIFCGYKFITALAQH